MAETLSLKPGLFAEATPAGAYYAVASPSPDSARSLLMRILKEGSREHLTEKLLQQWTGGATVEKALQLLHRLQRLEFVQGSTLARNMPEGNLESILPGLLSKIADSGRALLADDNGFYLASAGFHHEAAEEIAALAGDVLALGERHSLLLQRNLNIRSRSWSICDAAGRSELGFYPVYVGKQAFMLILGGTPLLQGENFVLLIEALARRYT